MFRKPVLAIVSAIALAASPAYAQEEAPEDALAGLAALLAPEPLTAEQQARLPLAQRIVDKLVPPGALGEVMGSMLDGFLGPLMREAGKPSAANVAMLLAVETDALTLSDEQIAEAAAILDPAMVERAERTSALMPQMMSSMMSAMEPVMRTVMSEVYAAQFNERELADIDAFFSTPSGAIYARKSLTMSSDPRFMGGIMRALPAMTESAAEFEAELAAASADLPAPRAYAELSASERARLAELTGLDPDVMRAGMETAAAERDAQKAAPEE